MPFPGLPNPLPSPSPLSGLEFFLQKLAMQDQASASQDKIKGLMSGIQTLISNEFPNADFEGGGGPSITTLIGKYYFILLILYVWFFYNVRKLNVIDR